VVVNGNIGHFLKQLDVRVPGVDLFIEQAVRDGKLSSPYYPDIFPIAYFVSRFYGEGKSAHAIAEQILKLRGPNGLWSNALIDAFAMNALMELGLWDLIRLEHVFALTQEVNREGFRPYAFCIDPVRNGKARYAGAPALTAAFVLEAVARFYTHVSESASSPSPRGVRGGYAIPISNRSRLPDAHISRRRSEWLSIARYAQWPTRR